MNSPPIEWTLGIGYLALLDYLRSRGDADGDTASECLRDVVAKHPLGVHAFTVALGTGSVWFWRHIVGPLR